MEGQERQGLSPSFFVILSLLIALGILLRWTGLSDRPIHHDESLHLTYAKYVFDHPTLRYYKYDPMLHGPLLYNVTAAAYLLGDPSVWTGRAVAAVLGTLLLGLPYLFRRYLSPLGVLVTTGFLSLSATSVYWSRFIRSDLFVVWGVACIGLGVMSTSALKRSLLIGLGFALQFCAKENAYVHVAILLGFLIFEGIISEYEGKRSSLFREIGSWLRRNLIYSLLGLVLFCFLYIFLYTAGFQYFEGLQDGLYRKSLAYWWEHHGKERIVGPFLYHFYILSWYEGIFIIAVFCQVFHFYALCPRFLRIVFFSIVACAFALAVAVWGEDISTFSLAKAAKVKDHFDVIGFILLIVHAPLVTYIHLKRGDRTLAFSGYLFFACLFTYSYLGEKVPWLAMYPFLAGVWYLSLYSQRMGLWDRSVHQRKVSVSSILFISGTVAMSLGVIFTLEDALHENWIYSLIGLTLLLFALLERRLRLLGSLDSAPLIYGVSVAYLLFMTLLTNFARAGEATELLSQVHTTEELDFLALKIRDEIEYPLGRAKRIHVSGHAIWPLTWYFRDLSGYSFTSLQKFPQTFDYVIKDYEPSEPVPPGFSHRRIPLRGWWVPDYREMTLKSFLGYALFHYPWNRIGVGYAYASLYVKNW